MAAEDQSLRRDLMFTDRAGEWVEDEAFQVRLTIKVEHVEDRSGELVERKRSQRLALREGRTVDKAEVPIGLDKPQARGLVGYGVVDEVRLGPGRDHDERQPRSIAATARARRRIYRSRSA